MASIGTNLKLWQHRRIPFEFAHESGKKHKVIEAMKKWESLADIKFVERTDEVNYVKIILEDDYETSSYLGMKGGVQELKIAKGKEFLILHELGHTLGLIHEQCRYDRDDYVQVNIDNIEGARQDDFSKVDEKSEFETEYDIKSVMHYPISFLNKGWGAKNLLCTECDKADNFKEKELIEKCSTMYFKKDAKKKIGALFYQGFENFSDLDKSDKALRNAYNSVKMPMGDLKSEGHLEKNYEVQLLVKVGNKQYIYGQSKDKNSWFTREIEDGTLKANVNAGNLDEFYEKQVAVNVKGKTFIICHTKKANKYSVYEIESNGILKKDAIFHGNFVRYQDVLLNVEIEGRSFLYGQCFNDNHWIILEVDESGKFKITAEAAWKYSYKQQCIVKMNNKTYLYGENNSTKNWFIQEIEAGGKMGLETDSKGLVHVRDVAFSYQINNKFFFYGQNLGSKEWCINYIKDGGKMGRAIQVGKWTKSYDIQFTFSTGNKAYLYGFNCKDKHYFIQELLDE